MRVGMTYIERFLGYTDKNWITNTYKCLNANGQTTWLQQLLMKTTALLTSNMIINEQKTVYYTNVTETSYLKNMSLRYIVNFHFLMFFVSLH